MGELGRVADGGSSLNTRGSPAGAPAPVPGPPRRSGRGCPGAPWTRCGRPRGHGRLPRGALPEFCSFIERGGFWVPSTLNSLKDQPKWPEHPCKHPKPHSAVTNAPVLVPPFCPRAQVPPARSAPGAAEHVARRAARWHSGGPRGLRAGQPARAIGSCGLEGRRASAPQDAPQNP